MSSPTPIPVPIPIPIPASASRSISPSSSLPASASRSLFPSLAAAAAVSEDAEEDFSSFDWVSESQRIGDPHREAEQEQTPDQAEAEAEAESPILAPAPAAPNDFPRHSVFGPVHRRARVHSASASSAEEFDLGDDSDSNRAHQLSRRLKRSMKIKWKVKRRKSGSMNLPISALKRAIIFVVARAVWLFYSLQAWLICLIVGVATGLIAALVDTAVHWVIDLRSGFCVENYFLPNSLCCALANSAAGPNAFIAPAQSEAVLALCPQWRSWAQQLYLWGWTDQLPANDYLLSYGLFVGISVLFAVFSCWLVLSFAPYAAGGGAPEIKTILGGVVIKKVLGGWTLLIKCVALPLSVGSGLSVGKEGPFCHIAACVGNITCRFFPSYRRNYSKINEILSAACAAGVAVAFGAPVGGILYSLEEMSSYFPQQTMWRAFFCALAASLSVQYLDPFQEGKLVQFEIDYSHPWQWAEMLPFALIGSLGGLTGAFFIKYNLACQQFRRQSIVSRFPMLEVAVVALITAVLKFQSNFTRGNFNPILEALFSDCSETDNALNMCELSSTSDTLASLAVLFLLTLLLSTYSIGMRVPAGLLIPSLVIGASLGRLVGTAVRYWQLNSPWSAYFLTCDASVGENCITPGVYALVGGASVLGGVTRMTIALAVIMFEITGGLNYLLPIMIGLVFSKLVGDAFGRHSIYEGAIAQLRYPFLDVKDELPVHLRVRDAVKSPVQDLLVLGMFEHSLASLYQLCDIAARLNISGFPVVTSVSDLLVVGYCARNDLLAGLARELGRRAQPVDLETKCFFGLPSSGDPSRLISSGCIDLRSCLHSSPVQVVEDMPLHRLHELFSKLGLRYSLVVRFGKLVGIVTKKDILNTLADENEGHH